MMFATAQLVDLAPRATLRAILRRPSVRATPGLRFAAVALFAPLALGGLPRLRRAGLLAFWDDAPSFDSFVEDHPIGRRFSGGFEARLSPLRAHGEWPGLPDEVPRTRAVPHDGPVVVLTLSRLRMSQTARFLRTSRPAEEAALAHDGMIWGSAAARPPLFATLSIWRSSQAAAGYAYGRQRPAHAETIDEQQRKGFSRRSAFIRFAPVRLSGSLAGTNPLDLGVLHA